MTATTPTGTALYAALSEQVYNRDKKDQSFTDADLFGVNNAGFSLVSVAGLEKTIDGYYYNKDASDPQDLGNGFAARVVEQNGKFIITFRGTDWAGGFGDILTAVGGFHDAQNVDGGDISTNIGLGNGTFARTQLDDALALVEAILAWPGVGVEDVVLTGQSLGGGLAGLVGAVTGIETHVFAPAPFENQLGTEAKKAAVRFVSETNINNGGFAEAFNSTFLNADIETKAFALANLDQTANIYLKNEYMPQVAQIKTLYAVKDQEFKNIYLNNINSKININTISGEMLTAGPISVPIDAIADHFSPPNLTPYDFGEGSDVSLNASISLHSPVLHALAALTHDSNSQSFASLLKDNKNLRGALLEEAGIAGAIEHGRADALNTVGSKVGSGGPNAGVLYRALWKSFLDQEDKLYDYVYKFFNETIKAGAAGEGFNTKYTDLNITNGITKLALGVLRAAVVDTESLTDVKAKLSNNWDFAGVKENGEPETGRIIIDINKIADFDDEFKNIKVHQGLDGKVHGVREINTALWEKTAASLTGFGNAPIAREFAKSIFGMELHEVRAGAKSIGDWKVLVAQAGDNNGVLDYTAATNNLVQSHVIFGGNGAAGNKIDGSVVTDYVVGGDGNDEFEALGGDDLFLGGGGNDTYIAHYTLGEITFVGGSGTDTAVYGTEFDDTQISIDVVNHPIHNFLTGVTVSVSPADVSPGEGDPEVVDTLFRVERIELGAGNEDAVISDAAHKMPLEILFGAGDSTIQRIKDLNPDAPGDDFEKGGLIEFHFELENATEGFTQHLITADDFAAEERPDAIVTVDGKQLVGGAAFDFNKFEMRTGDFAPFSPFFQDREYGPVETLDVYQAARAASISALFGQASNLASTNPVLPGLGPTGIGIGLGLFFGSLGIHEAIRWNSEWVSAYEQVILGWHGERYILSPGPSDGPRRLTIILDAEDTQARQEIVIDNWKQGDFGIRIEEFEPGQGLETGTNKNGAFDQWSDFTDAQIQAQLAALGFAAPPPPGAGAAAAAQAAEPGLVRQGNEVGNELGGGAGNDLLRGAEGDDELIGSEGFDTYVFAAGDGHDTIYDASAEGGRIQFLDGVDLAAVTQVEVDDGSGGMNLLITYGNGDTITIVGWSSLAQETKDAWVIEGLDGPIVSPSDPALTPDTSERLTEQIGTTGDDEIEGSDLAGILDGLAGNDILRGNGGDDQVLGGSGNDTVSGGDGDDRIIAGDGDDIIRGGRGNDDIDGGKGDDIYFFDLGDGADTIRDVDGSFPFFGSTDTNRIIFGEGISAGDIRVERDPDATDALILHIGANGDRIRIVDQYEPAHTGFDGIEEFAFQDGTLWSREDVEELYFATAPTDGDDTIVGFEHLDDVIAGGAGNDTLVGSGGSDTYLWNRGDGNDLIVDKTIFNQFDGDIDVLRFGSGIAATDVAVSRPAGGFDLVLTVSGADGGQITVFDFFREFAEPYTNGIEFVQFSDGTTWDKKRLFELSLEGLASDGNDVIAGSPGVDVIDGGLGDDNITGGLEDDTLIGGAGNDVLRGDGGNDTYIFGASFGKDEITERGPGANSASTTADRIVFTEYDVADFTFRLSGSDEGDLLIERVGSEDSLLVTSFLHSLGRVETYEFADGVEITWEQIRDIAEISVFAPSPTNGTQVADILTGTELGDRLFGLGGDDQLDLGAGSDIGYGGAGVDTINGGAGRDVLFGGDGNDVLNAGAGDDMVFGGTGQDSAFGDAGNDVLDGGLQDDTLDGGAGDDELKGGAGNDDLSGGIGNDVLLGGAGNDIYRFARGDGQDIIRSQHGREDGDVKTLVLGEGLTQDNIRFEITGVFSGSPSLEITFANGTTDSITVEHFTQNGVLDRIVFADDSEILTQQILERATGATAGDDNPAPSSGTGIAHLIYGGRGNDVLNTVNSKNIFVFGRGDGDDTINIEGGLWGVSDSAALHVMGYAPEEVILTRTGAGQNDLTLTFVGSDDRVTISKHFGGAGLLNGAIDEIVFQNGTTWDREALSNLVLKFAASDGNDTLVGGSSVSPDERLEGGLGDDSLAGGSGSDTYVYALGDGSDVVNDAVADGNDVDRLELGAGLTPADVVVGRSQSDPDDIVLTMPDGGQIVLVDQLVGDARGVERVVFLNGTFWTREELASRVANSDATSSNDVIQGSAHAETIVGGLGDDTLNGGDGGDVYHYALGDGSDQIVEGATGGKDRLRFDESIVPDDVTLARDPANPDTLRIDVGDGSVITVASQFVDGMGLELIVFADGTRWDRSVIQAKALEGSSSQGDDTLIGTSNDDVLFGAEGNDTLDGGAGSDLYVFRIGDGQDVLQDSGGQEGVDRVMLGDGIDQQMVDLGRDGDNLTLSLRDTADGITVVDYFVPGNGAIGAIEFRDGAEWDAAEIVARANNQAPVVGVGIAQQIVAQNANFSLSIPSDAFNDPDVGDTLTYAASLADGSPLPDWLNFDGLTFSGVPANDDVGPISVRVTAVDGFGDRQMTDFVLEVSNINDAPVAGDVLASQAAPIGAAFAYTVSETLFSDPDASILGPAQPDLTYSAEMADGSPLPSWLSFDGATRSFSGTPPAGSDGALSVRVIASDGQASGSALLSIAVGGGNSAPNVLTPIAAQQANEEATFVFVVPENAFADATPGDRLTYSATLEDGSPLPAWLSFDARTGTFTGVPSNDDVGSLSIRVTAADAYNATASSIFVLDVADVNDAPTGPGVLDSHIAQEQSLFDHTIPPDAFQDMDLGDSLILTAQQHDGRPLPSWLTFENGRFTGTPDDEDVNVHHIVVTATDSASASVSADFFLFVEPVNDAPEVVAALPEIAVDRFQEFTFELPVTAFQDVDDLGLSFSASSADGSDLPQWLTFDPLTRTFSGDPDSTSVGTHDGSRTYQIKVTATDAAGASVDALFDIVVQAPFPGDTINGTSGNDVIEGTDGPDTITGGAGNDELVGNKGKDTFVFGPGFGQDVINGFLSDGGNRIVFEAGIAPGDVSLSRAGSTTVFMDADNYLSDLVISIAGTSDQITVERQFGSLINGLPVVSEIQFADGPIWDAKFIASQFLVATAGDDILAGDGHDNVINGDAGSDELFGLGGNDTLNGGGGDDILYGAHGDDIYIFEIGTGSDLIVDEASALPFSFDTLRFGAGITPDDLIFTRDFNDPRVPGEQSFVNENNLRIEYAPTGDNVVILYQYKFRDDKTGGIERFEFADGTVYSIEEFDRLVSPDGLLLGTAGDDDLQGTSLAETIVGGLGDDTLRGGLGDDTYRWSLGDGNDSIDERDVLSFDALEFGAGIRPEDVAISRPVNPSGSQYFDLYFDILPTGERITVESGVIVDVSDTGEFEKPIDEVRFEDGTVWSFSFIASTFLQGTSGDDLLIGYDPLIDLLDGGAGNDELRGLGGSDTYAFGLGYGTDTVFDFRGSFFIRFPNDPRDFVRFNEGILPSDIEITRNLEIGHGGRLGTFTNLSIANTQDTLRLNGDADYILEVFFRETGTTWTLDELKDIYLAQNVSDGDDVLIGFGDARTFDAGAGNDRLIAHYHAHHGPEGDVLIGGDGNDTYEVGRGARLVNIEDGGLVTDVDVLFFNQDFQSSSDVPADVSFRRAENGLDLYIWDARISGAPSIVLRNFFRGPEFTIEEIRFAEGTVLTVADILARTVANPADSNIVTGTAAAETITGDRFTAETIDGGAGDDTLIGGDGESDVYLWSTGDGNDVVVEGNGSGSFEGLDVIKFTDVNASDVSILKSWPDLQLRVNTTGEVLTIEDHFNTAAIGRNVGIEEIVFANGEIWRRDFIDAQALIEGTGAGDILAGTDADDRFLGGAGDDVINSADGDDTFVYRSGDGSDTINETGQTKDTLEFADLNASAVELSRVGQDLSISIIATNDTISVTDQFDVAFSGDRPFGIEQIFFADGTIWDQAKITEEAWIRGTAGNDTLNGSIDDETLQGRAGNDILVGASGNDTYKFNLGDGLDTISEATHGFNSHDDAVELGSGIAPGDIVLTRENNGSDLAIAISGTTDKIVVGDQFATATSGIERVVFADGTVWSRDQLVRLSNPATAGDDTLVGDETDNVMNGEAGNDTITGLGGKDAITGGLGNDSLAGGADSDTYFYARGDGNDIINDGGPDGEVVDRLIFAADILPSDISVERSADGEDFILRVIDTGETITLQDRLISATGGVDEVVFSDGTHWDFISLESLSLSNVAPVATADSGFTTDEDQAVTILASALLANDTDADNDTLTIVSVQGAVNGSVALDAQGDVEFTPSANHNGPASFTYTVSDGNGGTSTATVDLTVNAVNDAPVATADSGFTADEDQAVTILASALLANDTDADNDTLTITSVQGAVNGTVALDAQGDVEFTPSANHNGPASFTYTVSDSNGGTSTATVDLTINAVNDAPVAVADSGFSTNEDTLVTILASALLTNDTDADNDTLTIVSVQGAVNGTVVLNAQGDVEFMPSANHNGPASFTYTVSDGNGGTSTATVDLTVNAVNDAPVATADSGFATDEDQAVTILASALLANDTDADNDTLTITSVQGAVNGTVALDAQGDVVFTPSANYNGPASFTYTVSDSNGGTSTATVDLTVNATSSSTITGTTGDDTLIGTTGDDVIQGLAGNDTLEGGLGADTYLFNVGDGTDVITDAGTTGETDVLQLGAGIDPAAVQIERGTVSFWDMRLVLGGSDEITVTAHWNDVNSVLEEIRFHDGTVWTEADTRLQYLAQHTSDLAETVNGFLVDDVIDAKGGDDSIYAYDGDDTLIGGAGDDFLVGGSGNDTYVFADGDGADWISDFTAGAGSNDVLDLTAVAGLYSLSDVLAVASEFNGVTYLDLAGTDEIALQGVSVASLHADDFLFAPGNFVTGTAGNDTLIGTDQVDIIEGKAGNDTLQGGLGGDTYVFNVGDGTDVITDVGTTGETDVLQLGAGITPASVQIERGTVSFWDMRLVLGGSDEITVTAHWNDVNSVLEEIRFDDGAVWTEADTRLQYLAQHTSDLGETVDGFLVDDVIDAKGGDDSIYAYDGDDTLIGGAGDDFLVGGAGNDTFVFADGDGFDWISDFTAGAGSNDVVDLRGVASVNSFSEVMAVASEFNGVTYLDLAGTDEIALAGVSLASLHEDDFRFV